MINNFSLIHTSDFHLGQIFYNYSLIQTQRKFIQWFSEYLQEEKTSFVLLAGDIYHTGEPSFNTQKVLYEFFRIFHSQKTNTHLYLINGNHDSHRSLSVSIPLIAAYNIHIFHPDMSANDLVSSLYWEDKIVAYLLSLPFMNQREMNHWLKMHSQEEERTRYPRDTAKFIQSFVPFYFEKLLSILKEKDPHFEEKAILAMAHLPLVPTGMGHVEEFPIYLGNIDILPPNYFPEIIDYLALGHIHKYQKISSFPFYYSGSPLALSFDEEHSKYLLKVHFINGSLKQVDTIPIPKFSLMLTVGDTPEKIKNQLKLYIDAYALNHPLYYTLFLKISLKEAYRNDYEELKEKLEMYDFIISTMEIILSNDNISSSLIEESDYERFQTLSEIEIFDLFCQQNNCPTEEKKQYIDIFSSYLKNYKKIEDSD